MKRITENRTDWRQTMCDIRIRPNLIGLSKLEKKIAKMIYDYIPHYRYASRQLANSKWYRITKYDYTATLYYYDGKNVEHIASTTKHRISRIMKNYGKFLKGEISAEIWENYCTGGYNTQFKGLLGNYGEKQQNRIKDIGNSHADCLEEGKQGHNMRVALRN